MQVVDGLVNKLGKVLRLKQDNVITVPTNVWAGWICGPFSKLGRHHLG